jgi:hypothetical protein
MAAWVLFVVSAVLLLPSTSSAQTINACVGKNGTIRIVAAGEPCPRGDTPLMWNRGLRVYDADGVEIGPLMSAAAVTFYLDDQGFSAAVGPGPEGWVQSQTTYYYLNSSCTGDRYALRSSGYGSAPAEPPPPSLFFFISLQVAGNMGYYQIERPTLVVVPPSVPTVWRNDFMTGACTEQRNTASDNLYYWLGRYSSVELPFHPGPFTIR